MRFIISGSPIIVYSTLQRITRAALTTTGISYIADVPVILISSRITRVYVIDIKKVDKQLTHAMHVKDRHVNDTFIDKLTKWYQ